MIEESSQPEGQMQKMSPREVLMKYLPFWPLFAIFVAACLFMAFIKLRYEPNVFVVKGTLMIQEQSSRYNRPEKIEEVLFASSNKNIQDEIQVITSTNTGKRVAGSLGMEVQYFNRGKIRSTILMREESPFRLAIVTLKDSSRGFSMPVQIVDEKHFLLTEKGSPLVFGQAIENNSGTFILERTDVDLSRFSSNLFVVSYAPLEERGRELVGGVSAAPSGESSNIVQISFETENPKMGVQIINQWMKEYQASGLEEKRQAAENTLRFINEQLESANKDLGSVEKSLLNFREKNLLINTQQQSAQIFESLSELDKEITKQNVQMKVVDNLIGYISDNSKPYRQVFSNLGIEEPSLVVQITEFNKLQVDREVLLRTTTRSNPTVVNMEAGIEKLRQDILQNLNNIRKAYQVSVNSLSTRNEFASREISKIPVKEKELLDITRRQKILEQLYSFLLQKKLETSIGSASTISNVKVVEPAKASLQPVRPNRKNIYLTALLAGLGLPAAFVFLLEFLNDKVSGKADIQKVTRAPIIGEISHSDEKTSLVVTKGSRKFIAEQFRMIRTNLQYVLPKQEKAVFMVTSSTSGEGKSFISTNIAAAMALSGKKTVILEFDIRKPKILAGLGLGKGTGITNFIIGKAEWEQLILPVPNYDNLYVIPCGPIPPNPSELLLDSKLHELMTRAREDFDVVIIDTAPVGLVSDAMVLGKFADATLYVVRHNYTFKKQLELLEDLYSNQRIPKISLVVNDIYHQGGYGKYYGYSGYGYSSYGYGYGSEYFEDKKQNRGFMNMLKQRFTRSRS